MDHLSSCYFCGTTLDETLRDYRVVPAELRDTDDATTATLCQSCHGKLERLLAPVVEAAGGDGVTLDARAAPARRESDPDVTDAPDSDSGSEPDDATEPSASGGTVTETADPEAGGDTDGDDPLLGDVEANLVDIDDRSPAETDEENATDEDTDSGDVADSGGDIGDGTDTGQEEETREDDADGDADGGGQSDAARTTVSALEYNKVMRLLQNREFPVDRKEFVTVAANAYGLAEHECGEVIDLAIDRGLVDERDGQLVRHD